MTTLTTAEKVQNINETIAELYRVRKLVSTQPAVRVMVDGVSVEYKTFASITNAINRCNADINDLVGRRNIGVRRTF